MRVGAATEVIPVPGGPRDQVSALPRRPAAGSVGVRVGMRASAFVGCSHQNIGTRVRIARYRASPAVTTKRLGSANTAAAPSGSAKRAASVAVASACGSVSLNLRALGFDVGDLDLVCCSSVAGAGRSAGSTGNEGLRRGQQDLRWIAEDLLASGLADVAVPQTDPAPQPRGVALQPGVQVVQQCPEGTHVDDRETGPLVPLHRVEQREAGSLRLAPGRGRQQDRVIAVNQRTHRLRLQRPQRTPPECVHDVVHENRARTVEAGGHGRPSSMSSAERAAAFRSTSVSSDCARVRA